MQHAKRHDWLSSARHGIVADWADLLDLLLDLAMLLHLASQPVLNAGLSLPISLNL